MNFERFVALRYLRSKRKEVFISVITAISVLGVALSVTVLDIVLSVMSGFEGELQRKLIDANAHITVRSFMGEMTDYEEIVSRVKTVPGVTAAYPYTYHQAMLTTPHGARGILIRGVDDSAEPRSKLGKVLTDPSVLDKLFLPAEIPVARPDGSVEPVQLPPIIVGDSLARSLYLAPENPVTLFAPKLSSSPQGLVPRLKRFVPVGRYKSGLIEYENGLAFLSMSDAQKFFGLEGAVSGVELSVAALMEAPRIAKQVYEALGGEESGLTIQDWTELNRPLWEAIKLEKKVYFIVLLLLILIASFSIVSTLVMVVMEKSRDIAILKSLGATDSNILRIFLMQGCIIGGVGIVIGTLGGFIGCLLLQKYGFPIDERVFGLETVPVYINPRNFIVVAFSAFIITASAGVYPAMRGARLRPADALRFE
jgi:lipoprotein-releasing system permease protein